MNFYLLFYLYAKTILPISIVSISWAEIFESNYKKRLVDDELELYLKTFSAILIEGPRWCGKTWSSVHNSKSTFFVADPKENFNNR